MCLHCALMLELLFGYVHDSLHWMLSTLMCSNAGALIGHVRCLHDLLLGHVSVLLTLVL